MHNQIRRLTLEMVLLISIGGTQSSDNCSSSEHSREFCLSGHLGQCQLRWETNEPDRDQLNRPGFLGGSVLWEDWVMSRCQSLVLPNRISLIPHQIFLTKSRLLRSTL